LVLNPNTIHHNVRKFLLFLSKNTSLSPKCLHNDIVDLLVLWKQMANHKSQYHELQYFTNYTFHTYCISQIAVDVELRLIGHVGLD